MHRKLIFALMLALLITQFVVPTAFAAGEPAGSCAPAFMLETAMDHEEHHHQHVGSDVDRNGDGFICMKHVTPGEGIHVHVDNRLP